MTLVTSTKFASITATGADWRDVARHILEGLEPLRNRADPFNIGFLYVSDLLSADLDGMLSLLRSVTGIEHWTGAVGIGVCGNAVDHIDTPAASVMVGSLPEGSFKIFPSTDLTLEGAREALEPWLDEHDPMLMLVHGDPLADTDPGIVLQELELLTGGFIAGGLSSSRQQHYIIADEVSTGGIGGIALSSDLPVATTLTQGCAPLGPIHTLTRSEGHVILELDGRNAFEVFSDDLKSMAAARSGQDPDQVKIAETLFNDEYDQLDQDIQNLFRGEVHVAFPVPGSDQNDYMVRNIIGLDPDSGHIAVAQTLENGQHIMFVHRDDRTIQTDLIRALTELRERLIREHGQFKPLGAIYISCVARSMCQFGSQSGDIKDVLPPSGINSLPSGGGGEMKMVRDIIGDVPLAGFYANGEISNRRLYGYTGVLILFL
jgi:small ligand-binding sensory domain FIST